MTSPDAAKQRLSEHDEHVHSILTRAGSEMLSNADFLAEYNISQSLAQRVTEMLKTPLTFFYNQHVNACKDTAELMRNIVVDHIKSVAETATVVGLWEVEREDVESLMEYTIALRDYTLENRALLRNFRSDYETTGFAELAPLVFHFIPAKRAANVAMSKKIELD